MEHTNAQTRNKYCPNKNMNFKNNTEAMEELRMPPLHWAIKYLSYKYYLSRVN